MDSVRVNFDLVRESCLRDKFMEVLEMIPREHWFDRGNFYADDDDEWTLLHFASYADNAMAIRALIAHGLDKEALTSSGRSPLHIAIEYGSGNPHAVKELILSGANPRILLYDRLDVWDLVIGKNFLGAIYFVDKMAECLLMLNIKPNKYQKENSPWLKRLESRFDRCRLCCISFLQVKKAGKLKRWDKYLLREIAYCIWMTRGDKKWEEPSKGICTLQ